MYDENSVEGDEGSLQPTGRILEVYADMDNIAEHLDEDKLARIAGQVVGCFDTDKQSQQKWLTDVEESLKLSKLAKEPKNTPLPNSANIKFPLITNACYQFAARTYPEIVQDGKVVKGEVVGKDNTGQLTDIAEAISTHMSYQLLVRDTEWEEGLDKLLIMLPNIGHVVKKTYFDPIKKKNVSIVCGYKEIVFRNDQEIQCAEDLRTITHVLYSTPNDLISNGLSGIYLQDSVDQILNHYANDPYKDHTCCLYEQHRYLDLDEDGYEEPYIVTVSKDFNKVLRIVARYSKEDIEYKRNKVSYIAPTEYFTHSRFLLNPDGSFMGVGFGTLMLHLNETVNTILNQLIDAGTLANMQGGFIDSRLKIQGGQSLQDPGMWNKVKGVTGQLLKDGVMPIVYKEPSQVLYQLLGLLIQASKELSSSTEVLQGTAQSQNAPAHTVMELANQGLKVFAAIQRRLYRSLRSEYQKLYDLNKIYLDPNEYKDIIVNGYGISENIYKIDAIRIVPVADPNLSSDSQRLAKAQYMLQLAQQPATGAYMNMPQLLIDVLKWINVPGSEKYIKTEAPPPDPKALKDQAMAQAKTAEIQFKARDQDRKDQELAIHASKTDADITKTQATAVKYIAEAHKDAHDAKIQEGNLQLDTIKTHMDAAQQAHKQGTDSDRQHKQMQLDQQNADRQHQLTQEAQNDQQSNDNGMAPPSSQ